MLAFLATVIEQLDLASEHVSKNDAHNARFALMLTDNAVELIMHQLATGKARELRAYTFMRKEYPHNEAVEKAIGRSFDAKVKFARLDGLLSEQEAFVISKVHEYRNEVYHIGLQHEVILPALAAFYYEFICNVLVKFKPRSFGYWLGMKLPERAQKYFSTDGRTAGKPEDFAKACVTLAAKINHKQAATIETFASHMDQVIDEIDTCIDIVAGGVYDGQKTTRDGAVIGTQAWPLAFSDKGKAFAKDSKWAGSSMLDLIDWLSANYPFQFKGDPIPSWKNRAEAVRYEKAAAEALIKYNSFMDETAEIREALMESARAVEAEIDNAIDRMRGN